MSNPTIYTTTSETSTATSKYLDEIKQLRSDNIQIRKTIAEKESQIEIFKKSNHELKQEVIGAKRILKSIEKLHLEKEIEYKTTI